MNYQLKEFFTRVVLGRAEEKHDQTITTVFYGLLVVVFTLLILTLNS